LFSASSSRARVRSSCAASGASFGCGSVPISSRARCVLAGVPDSISALTSEACTSGA